MPTAVAVRSRVGETDEGAATRYMTRAPHMKNAPGGCLVGSCRRSMIIMCALRSGASHVSGRFARFLLLHLTNAFRKRCTNSQGQTLAESGKLPFKDRKRLVSTDP